MRMRIYTLLCRSWIFVTGALAIPSEAFAGWGDQSWGVMFWGEATSVPTLGLLGLMVLCAGVAATAAWKLRKRPPALGLMLLLLTIPLVAVASTVTLPNRFVNGTVADADQVNANFDAVKTAVDDNFARVTAGQPGTPHNCAWAVLRETAATLSTVGCPVSTYVFHGECFFGSGATMHYASTLNGVQGGGLPHGANVTAGVAFRCISQTPGTIDAKALCCEY